MNKLNGTELELFLEKIPGLIIIDSEENVVYLNQQCSEWLQINRSESVGKKINEVFPPSVMPEILKGNKSASNNFYFDKHRISISHQAQIKNGDDVIGVLEYDILQSVEELEEILKQYTRTIYEEADYYKKYGQKENLLSYSIDDIVGTSDAIEEMKKKIRIAAASHSTVYIYGETGTGKELIAHSIHNLSPRKYGELLVVNSAELVPGLADSILFGYEEGSFTGGKKGGKKGLFELANNGTIFIDEIDQLSLDVQAKLLRVLQEHKIVKVGGAKAISVDVRIIVASNKKLENLVAQGTFKEDLFYRLNVFPIESPPLRARLNDIKLLTESKINLLNKELGKNVVIGDEKIFSYLQSHNWPVNIRELYNLLELVMNYAEGDKLTL